MGTLVRCLMMVVGVACAPAVAQTDAMVVTVSRNVDLVPDAVYITMAVVTDSDVSLEQVFAGQSDSRADG
jgi:hypothetical protein